MQITTKYAKKKVQFIIITQENTPIYGSDELSLIQVATLFKKIRNLSHCKAFKRCFLLLPSR